MCAVIKHLYLKGMTPQQIFSDMGETLGESAPTYSTDAKWHAEFKRGRSSSDDLHRCGRTATSVNEETVEVHKLVMSDGRLSVCYIATSVGISTGSVHSILTDNLLMKKVSARWVPRCYPTFRRQIELTHQQLFLACSTKIRTTLFHDC